MAASNLTGSGDPVLSKILGRKPSNTALGRSWEAGDLRLHFGQGAQNAPTATCRTDLKNRQAGARKNIKAIVESRCLNMEHVVYGHSLSRRTLAIRERLRHLCKIFPSTPPARAGIGVSGGAVYSIVHRDSTLLPFAISRGAKPGSPPHYRSTEPFSHGIIDARPFVCFCDDRGEIP